MKFVIILGLALVSALALPGKDIKSSKIVAPAGRISQGRNARKGQFPYQVGLRQTFHDGRSTWCGGCLISNTHVLTAAHCIDISLKVEVILGCTKRSEGEIIYEVDVQDIIIHEEFDRDSKANDICLIKIPYTGYTKNIEAVKLPNKGNSYSSYSGEMAAASGWGRISDSADDLHDFLQYAYMEIIPNNICGQRFVNIKTTNICVSTLDRVSTCIGDSGGGLVLRSSKTLVGISSFIDSSGCENEFPAVFTRVSSYVDWIERNCF